MRFRKERLHAYHPSIFTYLKYDIDYRYANFRSKGMLKTMIYKFKCPKCGTPYELNMRITEYQSNGHYCICGAELIRDVKDFCTVSQRKVDGFFGVSTEQN